MFVNFIHCFVSSNDCHLRLASQFLRLEECVQIFKPIWTIFTIFAFSFHQSFVLNSHQIFLYSHFNISRTVQIYLQNALKSFFICFKMFFNNNPNQIFYQALKKIGTCLILKLPIFVIFVTQLHFCFQN